MRQIRGGRLAYIPQEPMSNLDPSFTVGGQLTEPIRLKLGLSRNEARDKAMDLLARVGIPDPKRTFAAYPHELSGGMAQRVLIAGAVSCDPSLIIADEPTTALDVTIQAEILDLLRDLQQGLGMAVLLVTHNFGVVADLCDRVSVMQHGRIVETGPARSIFAAPRHPYTQSLFAAILEEDQARGPYAEAVA
jgi:peptide/nickel transport system permease protein